MQFQSAGRIWGFWNLWPERSFFVKVGSFNPPGGFGAFGTRDPLCVDVEAHQFQSAGRIWGFWNAALPPLRSHSKCFNPPGGFGAFGTRIILGINRAAEEFQSAGRIWGFWNSGGTGSGSGADGQFQSAGRIWGFWNTRRD